MKKQRFVLAFCLSVTAASISAAQTVDWDAVHRIKSFTVISVETEHWTRCTLNRVTDDELFCQIVPRGLASLGKKSSYLMFNREEILAVRVEPVDMSKGFLDLIMAAGTGGGLDSAHQPVEFVGVKLGGAFTLDLQYDRIQGNSGFSTEGSAVLPLFRFPRPQVDKKKKYLKLYVEPGVGYRAGNGAFGGYSSAKTMLLLVSDSSWGGSTPYIEFQRRFPFASPLQGDNRLTIGVMLALCRGCDGGAN
jgi:hypothetical protein